MSSKKKRKIWWVVGGSLSIVLFVAYALGTFSSIALNRELAEARSAGFPVEPEDLFLEPAPKDEDNAARFYEQMVELPEPSGKEYEIQGSHHLAVLSGYSDFDRDQVQSYFAANSQLIRLAESASDRPGFFMNKDWSNPVTVLFPELAKSKHVSKLFASRATLRQEEGDVEGALTDLGRILVIAEHMQASGHIIGQLVAIADRRIYAKAVETMASFPTANEQFYTGVLAQLDQWPTRVDWTQALRLEAYSSVWIPRNLDSFFDEYYDSGVFDSGWPEDESDWEMLSWRLPKTRNDAASLSLEYWTHVLETYDPDSIDPMTWARGIDARMPSGSGFWRASEALVIWFSLDLEPAIRSGISDSANREVLASSLVAILAYRQSNDYLASGLRTDPWSGADLIFKEVGNGFMLYSIGQNGIDDGGDRERSNDIVFEYPRARAPAPANYYRN